MEKITANTDPVENKQYLCATENWRHDGLRHCPKKSIGYTNPIDFYRELKTIRIVHYLRKRQLFLVSKKAN